MSTPDTLLSLRLLQHADSFFPSAGVAFSWGLETLHARGMVTGAPQVESFLIGQLEQRWATCDRPALERAFHAIPDLDALAEIDAELEALALARSAREGSRRAGGALLRVHAELDTPLAATYRQRVRSSAAYGHLAVVQALVWRGAGLDPIHAAIASAHGLCVGVLGAAVRLGVLGHLDAQRILRRAGEVLQRVLAHPPPQALSAFVPAADIAMMQHETQHSRLFVN